MVTGPFLPRAEQRKLTRLARGLPVHVIRTVNDSLTYLSAADVVIAMAGYNTTAEIFTLDKPALLVPRSGPSAEQQMRAKLFADRGWVNWLPPADLSPDMLAQAARLGVDHPPTPDLPAGSPGSLCRRPAPPTKLGHADSNGWRRRAPPDTVHVKRRRLPVPASVARAEPCSAPASQWALRCGYQFLAMLARNWTTCCPVSSGQMVYVSWCTTRWTMAWPPAQPVCSGREESRRGAASHEVQAGRKLTAYYQLHVGAEVRPIALIWSAELLTDGLDAADIKTGRHPVSSLHLSNG